MAELRWILLLAGLVFLLALAAWEQSRARRARRAAELDDRRAIEAALAGPAPAPVIDVGEPGEPGEPEPAGASSASSSPAPIGSRRIEPTLDEAALIEPVMSEPAMPAAASAPIEANPPLRVEWPDERARRILAVRIVAPAGQRLGGRAVRQALGACGFVHGPYRIYHQPALDGRALISCANLTQPGDFDPLTLDFQRLTGLSLFAVLPGPLPPPAALEHLLETAGDLARRVDAVLADERGAPLDEARVARLTATAQEWMTPGASGARAAGVPGSVGASGA